MKKIFPLVILALVLPIFSLAQVSIFGSLSGANEVPANPSSGRGKIEGIFDPWSRVLAFRLEFSGLVAPATAAHFHNNAAGVNGPVVLDLGAQGFPTGVTAGELVRVLTLTAAQATDLMSGRMYVNIHNATYPGGEIRAQLNYGGSAANRVQISARLDGKQEVPANASTAGGTFDGIFDPFSRVLAFRTEFSGLSANASAAHFHIAAAGVSGPVSFDLGGQGFPTGVTAGEFVKVVTFNQAQADALAAGNMYINVHNSTFPGGEIRGQLNWNKPLFSAGMPVNGTLSGAQEVPANTSAATGLVFGAYDAQRKLLALKFNYSGLAANATASHIHRAAAGVAGPVMIDLAPWGFTTGATSGNFAAIIPVDAAFETNLLAGNTYVNIHNATYPGGEIRAQLNVTVLKPAPAADRDEPSGDLKIGLPVVADLSIFPNPAQDFVKISRRSGSSEAAHIRLLDASGRLLSERTTADELVEWQVEGLPRGFYFFQIFENGRAAVARKWLKK